MLTPSSAAVVKATLPVVGANAEAITANFYPRLFAAHPELLNLFNQGNQANGRQRQALAAAVCAYAQHLVDGSGGDQWARIFERIAHKHASLGISPAQYPIVGRHLMAAVGDVLGEAVTPEIAAAWDEVYWLFACQLVAREARLYHQAGADSPAHWRAWRVVERTAETDDVVSFALAPEDGRPAGAFTPGQYVSVAVDLGGGARQIRQYSLSCAPGGDTWQISVKRLRAAATAPAGQVSGYLHERVGPGDRLLLSPPFGEVSSVAGDGPLLLISAGIGITPAMSALEDLARRDPYRPVTHVHADRACATHALRRNLPRLAGSLRDLSLDIWYEYGGADKDVAATGARINAGWVDPDRLPFTAEATVHLCGPLPFMHLVRTGLLRRGVPAERIGYEVFGPGMLPG